MKFRHKIEKVNINGLKEYAVNYFLCDELVVGRGSSCLIRLESRLVGLSHAKLTSVDNQLVIEDLQSDSGTRVNGIVVTKKALKDGDRVKVGDVEFHVFHDGTYWGFLEKREEKIQEDREEVVKKQIRLLDLTRYYPRFSTFSCLLFATITLFCFADQVKGYNRMLWTSGELTNSHKMIENNCTACHAIPFQPVRDEECLTCHAMSEHAKTLENLTENHPEMKFRCATCHKDHNGTKGLIENSSRLCAECHADLATLLPSTKHPKVASFHQHPQFSVTIPQYSGAEQESLSARRVTLDDRENLRDTTRLKLNHEKHLVKDLRGPDGPETLQCLDCHKLTADLKKIVPMNYEANCARCHPLGFDERLAEKAVPHGDPDVVFNYLYAEYAKLFLETEKKGARKEFIGRFRPGQAPAAENPDLNFTREFVEQESRSAEKQLFTKTACFLCHQVKDTETQAAGKSNFIVLKPNMPDRWMPAALFEHGSHQEMTCESCHPNVRSSKETSDVLMPKVSLCQKCHEQAGKTGKVASECSMCHSYHDSLLMVDRAKRNMREIITQNLAR